MSVVPAEPTRRLRCLTPPLILVLAMFTGCESSGSESGSGAPPEYNPRAPGHSAALLIDYQSLPSHRHTNELDKLQRAFLEQHSAGDRLVLAGKADDDSDSVWTLSLPDSPLETTRLLRRLRERLAEGRQSQWQERDRVIWLASRQLASLRPSRCLYLALDPGSAPIPTLPDDEDSDIEFDRGEPFNAFLLTPAGQDPDRISMWVRYLHEMGAERVMRVSLGDALPGCR